MCPASLTGRTLPLLSQAPPVQERVVPAGSSAFLQQSSISILTAADATPPASIPLDPNSLATLEYQESLHDERRCARMVLADLYMRGYVPGKDHKDAIALYSQLLRHYRYPEESLRYLSVEAILCGQLLQKDDCIDKKEPALGNKTPFERNIELMESGEAIGEEMAFCSFEALLPIVIAFPESKVGQTVRANAEKIVDVMNHIILQKSIRYPVEKEYQLVLALNFLKNPHFQELVNNKEDLRALFLIGIQRLGAQRLE